MIGHLIEHVQTSRLQKPLAITSRHCNPYASEADLLEIAVWQVQLPAIGKFHVQGYFLKANLWLIPGYPASLPCPHIISRQCQLGTILPTCAEAEKVSVEMSQIHVPCRTSNCQDSSCLSSGAPAAHFKLQVYVYPRLCFLTEPGYRIFQAGASPGPCLTLPVSIKLHMVTQCCSA